jgi:hypothetical protein
LGMIAVEIAQDGVGFAVEALPGDVALLGMGGYVSAATEKDYGGTGKLGRKSYDAHGVSNSKDIGGGTSVSLQMLALLLSSRTTLFRPF